ncbi:aldo/keto reductase [Nonomuraea rubra]|uniref:Diketogulonate reductase-like aldo/keto reductase n=2 Tax=Nonomuraea rubra TaxID=46180 RepID=A0A7X0U1M6_9ACTN|nr:aldo/keto reductase [Nonomuraea rubra]MBB6551594.1 diketogulonate reductase-like aldo/keto reductase [Nonomuraea rubra]
MRDKREWSPTRRQVITAGGLGAAAGVLPAEAVHASAPIPARTVPDDVITRTIPGTRERLPAIGLGTFMTFDTVSDRGRERIREVARRHWQEGGRVFDVSPLYGRSEVNLGDFASEMRINDRMFLANKIWATGDHLWDDGHAADSLRRTVKRLSLDKPVDLMQCHSLTNVDVIIPLLHAWKKEGRIRYLGVTHHEPTYFGVLASWVERAEVDFVQVHYSIHTRAAEERVIRAAADRGVAVLVNMPLEKARLHKIVENHQVPDFARELGMDTWSQYFLKWVISNPAVTCALPATTNPAHLAENVAAMRGELPDAETRDRMVRHMETIPGFDELATMPWYPGKTFNGLVSTAQAAVRKRSPWWPS